MERPTPTAEHRSGLRLSLVLVGLAAIAVACASLKGDLVETGMDAPSSEDLAFTIYDEDENDNGLLSEWETTELPDDAPAPEAFQFDALNLISGESVEGSALFEQRPLIIAFTVPGCPVCVREAPKLSAAADLHPEISYAVVHSNATDPEYLSYIEDAGLSSDRLLHLIDGEISLWIHFGVLAQPSYILVDKEGVIRSSTGALEDHGLERAAEIVAK